MCKKFIVITILMLVYCSLSSSQPPLNISAETLEGALPKNVVNLSKWSTNYDTQQLLENKSIGMAKSSSIGWIRTVIDPTWLPSEDICLQNNIRMIQDEFDSYDVSRVEWKRNDYTIQVAQTQGIILITLSPNSPIENTILDQKIEYVKQLSSQILNDTGTRYGIEANKNHIEIPVQHLKSKIVDYSFKPELISEFNNGLAGVAIEYNQSVLHDTCDTAANTNEEFRWADSKESWAYWWRKVNWYYDGESIYFFILKAEAGPIVVDYYNKYGINWFER